MSIELKIKAKHLALEPAIIRKEERKLQKMAKLNKDQGLAHNLLCKSESLRDHRRGKLRDEARATHLARAFIKGHPYKKVEAKRKEENISHILNRVTKMLVAYEKDMYAKHHYDCVRAGMNYKNIISAEQFYNRLVLNWEAGLPQ